MLCVVSLLQEAHNLTRFAAAHSYLGFADTPDVIWELTTTRWVVWCATCRCACVWPADAAVDPCSSCYLQLSTCCLSVAVLCCSVLTTTWVEGQTPGQILRQLQSLNSTGSTGNSTSSPQATTSGTSHADHYQRQQLLQLVDLGISATLHQLVVTGCLHGDPHTGNLLLSRGKLVFLDFGLLVDVPPEASVVSEVGAAPGWRQGLDHGLLVVVRLYGRSSHAQRTKVSPPCFLHCMLRAFTTPTTVIACRP